MPTLWLVLLNLCSVVEKRRALRAAQHVTLPSEIGVCFQADMLGSNSGLHQNDMHGGGAGK